jgi:exosortase/archaeosortase family protein
MNELAIGRNAAALAWRDPRRYWPRFVVVAAMVFGIVAAIRYSRDVRILEAAAVRWFASPFVATSRKESIVYVFPSHGAGMGFNITGACTVVQLWVPLLALAALLVLAPGVRKRRVFVGLLASLLLTVAINQVRVLIIVFSWVWWRDDGLWVAHILVGSVVTLIGIIAAATVQIIITGRIRSPLHHRTFA